MRLVIDYGKDSLFKYVATSINNPVITTVVNGKEIIIMSILKTLPLSPKILFMIALFL